MKGLFFPIIVILISTGVIGTIAYCAYEMSVYVAPSH